MAPPILPLIKILGYTKTQGLSRKVQPLLVWWERFVQHQCNLAAKESGLECTCVNNDFTVLVSGGGRCRSVSMCTVWLLHSKWLSNESASNFMSSLNIHWQKLFGWFRRLQLWATGDWQLHQGTMHLLVYYCLMQSFRQNIKSPSWFSHPTARFGILKLLAFSQD